jgi:hypothetical protein
VDTTFSIPEKLQLATGLAEIVSDDFPILHERALLRLPLPLFFVFEFLGYSLLVLAYVV